MRNTKKQAFTLVELIVVITILAILGTIAFISLQGYSADARNSKRVSDLGNIQSSISLKQVEGVPLLSFITSGTNAMASIALAGGQDATPGTEYAGGTPAYTVLNVVAKDFKDPQGNEYALAATSRNSGVFQVAATIEVDGVDQAIVNGTFNARGITAYTGSSIATVFTLDNAYANTFKKDDTVTLVGSTNTGATITKVSRNGVTLTLSVDVTSATTIALSTAESTGLVRATKDAAGAVITANTPVINDSGAALAY